MRRHTQVEFVTLLFLVMVMGFIVAIYEPVLDTATEDWHASFLKVALHSALTMCAMLIVHQVSFTLHVEGFMSFGAVLALAWLPFHSNNIAAFRGAITRFVLRSATSIGLVWATFELARLRGRAWPRYDDAIDLLVEQAREDNNADAEA